MNNVFEVVGYSDPFVSKKNGKTYMRIVALKDGGQGFHGRDSDGTFVVDPARITGGPLNVGSLIKVFYNRNGFIDEVQIVE